MLTHLPLIDYAHDHGLAVRFAAEDASRTGLTFLKEVYHRASEHGADLLSFADTVGCLTPLEMYRVMSDLIATVDRPLCAHCHNDMGCAVANTITAAEAGAFQLHTTVNGIGERAGNAALEEVLIALRMSGGVTGMTFRTWLRSRKKSNSTRGSGCPGTSRSSASWRSPTRAGSISRRSSTTLTRTRTSPGAYRGGAPVHPRQAHG